MFDTRPDRDTEVVFLGRSNVGKSTLMRAITGHRFDTGKRPGVTRNPNHYDWAPEDFVLTDLPGFGFMAGVDDDRQDQIKTDIVHYLETHADHILVAVLVVDGKSVIDIIDRHTERGDIPHDVELFHFLTDLEIPTVVAVNKTDKIDDLDDRLDDLCDRLGLHPPWQQWRDTIAPISAKKKQIEPLLDAINTHLHDQKRDDLRKFF